MFYVIILHSLGQGGVLISQELSGIHFHIAWLLEIMAYCAVNCFGLISGYVGYKNNSKLHISRYLDIWLQVVFYGLLITSVYSYIVPTDITWKTYVKACIPLTLNAYWYFSAYTGVYVIAPMINNYVNHTDNNSLKRNAILIISVFSLFSSFCSIFDDTFQLHNGYSFVWLTFLYFIGAVMKKTGLFSAISKKQAMSTVIVCIILAELWINLELCSINLFVFNDVLHNFIVSYTSPFILAIAIIHVSFFSKFKLHPVLIRTINMQHLDHLRFISLIISIMSGIIL